jgi:acyl-coenzyme A synthetase/AMP-(fatty) acid ligase
MTELQVGAYGRPNDPLDTRITSTGRAATGMRLRVVDPEGNDLPSGVEGELQARDSSVFTSYLNDQQASKAAFTEDDWFKTGDLATIDTDGYLRITGRTKEIINRGGIKYNPAEVEAILANHPAIAMCAIVPVPDPTLGERACLCVQTTPGHTITLEEACKLLDDNKMAKYKWPERLELFDELPMTPTRKVQRAKVAALLSK